MLSGVNSTLADSPAKVQSAGSSIQAESVNSVTLHVETYKLLEHKDLDSIGSNEDLMKTLLDKSTQLSATSSQLPPHFKEAATKLQRFSKDLDQGLLPARQALDHRHAFIESKSKLYKDLENLKKKISDLASILANVKASLADVHSNKAKLEEQLK